MSSRKLLSALSMLGAASAASNSSAGTTTSGSACACNALASSYPDLLLFPNSTDYATESIANWDKRGNMEPACVFLPTSADEVAKAVGTFNTCDAQFAVRGGGHMNYPGSNNINGGVLMALSGLSDLKIAADNSSIEVGPGNRWVDVYNFLDPYGRIAIGGRMKTIGVPGLTLIGGVHYFINKYGYAMDNVISYDVVLGDGSQVTASANSSSDLFWALKGGANNFGVVTKFVLKTHSVPQISTTIQAFDETEVQSFIQAVCDFTDASDASIGAGAVITITYNATTGVMSPSLLGVQEGTETPPSRFANFSAIPGVMKINNVTTPKQWAANLDSPLQMFRIQFGQHAIKTDADQIYELYKIWRDALDEIADVEGIYPTFVLNTAPASAAAVANTNGIGNTWGLDDDNYIWWQISTGWDNAEDDLRVQTWSKRLVTYMHSLNKEKGLSSEFVYMGDAGEWQDVFAGFAEGNVDKMKSIRSKYDPNGVFTRLNWGGFKLGL